jgi:hypothetical protein
MKRFYSKFRIGLITFAFGLASVFTINGSLQFSDEIPVNLPKTESSSIFEIITRENWKGFIPVGQGCGGRNKYGGESSATSYRTSEWKHVSVSHGGYENSKDAKKEIALRIGDASQVIKRNKDNIILENQDGNTKWIDVIKYDGKKSLEITSSTSLELIIEFEEWQKLRK